MSDVTQMLGAVERGEAVDLQELLPLVYDELRRLASHKMAQEAAGHTLQPTALVHEAWLRLVGRASPCYTGRAHFFSAAAEAMRRVLVDAARRRHSRKRGGGIERVELEESLLVQELDSEEVVAVGDALERLALEDPAASELVKLRYFVGLTMQEAAEALGLTPRTAERLWTYARAWLRQAIAAARS